MNRVFLDTDLETIAIYWRVFRNDGVTLGFASHDRDVEFDGIVHRAAPGMVPSAIRRTSDLEPDSAEVSGVLSHDSIAEGDLTEGRFDGARVSIGVVDWETLDKMSLYEGEMGTISADSDSFEAELRSAKAVLDKDLVPRTSPTCRAQFCGPGCLLNGARYSHERAVAACDASSSTVQFANSPPHSDILGGWIRWIDGPHAGTQMQVVDSGDGGLVVDRELSSDLRPGLRAILREGCDHTLGTCHSRFANAVNFQGEPFLPGNDALIRYPVSSS